MFSISIPVRFQADVLPSALRSLACQTAPFQLAVLDATPDGSVQAVLHSCSTTINYVYHHADQGQSAAIQEGWDNTAGEIVAWLNADDYYFPDTLTKVAEVFRQRPDVDVVYGHAVHVNAEDTFQSYFPAIDATVSRLCSSNIICQPACFVRRRAMQRVGGLNPAMHYVMDWDFWLRLYHAGCTFQLLDEPLAVVRVHGDTKTMSRTAQRYQEINRLLQANAGPLHGCLALLSCHYYDLLHRRRGWLDQVSYQALSLLRWLNSRRSPRQRHAIRGLECATNRVQGSCEVMLPWYQQAPASEVAIEVDQPLMLSVIVNGQLLEVNAAGRMLVSFLGQAVTAYCYKAALPSGLGKVLRIKIVSGRHAWRLVSVRVNGADMADTAHQITSAKLLRER